MSHKVSLDRGSGSFSYILLLLGYYTILYTIVLLNLKSPPPPPDLESFLYNYSDLPAVRFK